MDAIHALHNRTSVNLLDYPAPTKDQLDNMFKAGVRACDHKNLRPWKFLVIEGDHRNKFGKLMADVKQSTSEETSLSNEERSKLQKKPMRAPTIIAVVADIKQQDKVPEIEQLLSAGAAAQMMMTAAYAQGLGAIWRSGGLMFEQSMHQGLGLADNQKLVGFLYVGTPKVCKPTPQLMIEDYVEYWHG